MSKFKQIIIVTDPSVLKWRSLPIKLKEIQTGLNGTPNGDWEVTAEYLPLVPKVTKEGRIDHNWYNSVSYPFFKAGYNLVYIHFTAKDWKKHRLTTIIGANQIDNDFVGESYGWSDEHSKNNKGLNQFEQSVQHEGSHELARGTKTPDLTHSYKELYGDTAKIFSRYDMNLWQPVYQDGMREISRLQAILEKLKLIRRSKQLVVDPKLYRVTQKWLAKNSLYKSGVHNGLDIGVPLGTAIKAPLDGLVYYTGTTKELGNFCFFECEDSYHVFPHLSQTPLLRSYKRGETLGLVGGTGLSKGPHIHWTILKVKPQNVSHYVSLLDTKEKVMQNSIDPEVWIKN